MVLIVVVLLARAARVDGYKFAGLHDEVDAAVLPDDLDDGIDLRIGEPRPPLI
jgi:hypothetical protein